MREIAECNVNRDRLHIDPRAMVINNADIRRQSAQRGKV